MLILYETKYTLLVIEGSVVVELNNKERQLLEKYSSFLKKNNVSGFFDAITKGIASLEEINHITKFFVENCGVDVLNNISYVSSRMFEAVNIGKELILPERLKLVAEYGFAKTPIISVASNVPNFIGRIMDHAFDDCNYLKELYFVIDASKPVSFGKLCNLRIKDLVVYVKFVDDREDLHNLKNWERYFSTAFNYSSVIMREWD